MRLIDADAAIYAITVASRGDSKDVIRNLVIRFLLASQTVDAMPVIRCKDCKWYKTNYSWNGKEHRVCVIEPYEPVRKLDDFCSRAERKEE